ncbi:MAG: MFS transporter, partial [Novosphingobium sp.]
MPNQSKADDRFVLLYALAWAGGTIAYVPLLTILLPVQVEALAGPLQRVDWLAYVALAGALAASAGGILFGYLSDVTRNRRGWIVGGLALSSGMLLLIGRAGSLFELILAIVCWQLALNMMLGPLAAWAGDVVPDRRKGLLGGLMAFAPGLGALAGAIVTQPGLAQAEIRLGLVAALVVVCLLPVLLLGPSVGNTVGGSASPAEPANYSTADKKGTMSRMWLARLAVQVAEATLFAFLYFWLLEVDPNMTDNQTARLLSA